MRELCIRANDAAKCTLAFGDKHHASAIASFGGTFAPSHRGRGGEEPVANVRSPDSAYMDIRPSTRRVTETQLTKQALEALGQTREWAKELERAHPGTMPQEAVDRALDWAWAVWLKGTGMGAGHADFPVDTIISKMAR
ncbi:hypothetical protein L1887_62287 [Cichorium endivia]|nr:hypothetical protein L1887_62287 [Cichorium endivia]